MYFLVWTLILVNIYVSHFGLSLKRPEWVPRSWSSWQFRMLFVQVKHCFQSLPIEIPKIDTKILICQINPRSFSFIFYLATGGGQVWKSGIRRQSRDFKLFLICDLDFWSISGQVKDVGIQSNRTSLRTGKQCQSYYDQEDTWPNHLQILRRKSTCSTIYSTTWHDTFDVGWFILP